MKQLFLIIILIFLVIVLAKAQSINNIRFEQPEKQVKIYYDLSGKAGSTWNIYIYCSQDGGIIWSKPLLKLTGDFGDNIIPGTNKKVTWDVLDEREELEGEVSFKVVAKEVFTSEPKQTNIKPSFSTDFYKYKKSKNVWLVSAIVSSAIGTLSYLQSEKYYKQYQDATTDAADLHKKVELFDKIYPVAFGVAGFCAIEFIIKASKQNKAGKQTISFYPQPLNQGAGLGLACKF